MIIVVNWYQYHHRIDWMMSYGRITVVIGTYTGLGTLPRAEGER